MTLFARSLKLVCCSKNFVIIFIHNALSNFTDKTSSELTIRSCGFGKLSFLLSVHKKCLLNLCHYNVNKNKKLIRRWDSERELSLRRHCTRTKNTMILHKFRHRSILQRKFTKFSEITQCNGHYAVQGHSRSPILVPIESSYTTSC